jgi:hypothetical protein
MRSPADMGEEEIRSYLLYLLDERKLSHQSYRQAYAALKFLYTVTLKRPFEVRWIPRRRSRPRPLPDVLAGSEVRAVIRAIEDSKYQLLAMAIYGAGLRVTEACQLRIKDIDSLRMLIHVRHGKGNKDRYVMLSERLLQALRGDTLSAVEITDAAEVTAYRGLPMPQDKKAAIQEPLDASGQLVTLKLMAEDLSEGEFPGVRGPLPWPVPLPTPVGSGRRGHASLRVLAKAGWTYTDEGAIRFGTPARGCLLAGPGP